jgi:hypothetical protein
MWDERTGAGPVETGEWLWCGRWALVRLDERHDDDGQGFGEKVLELVCNVHMIAPIAEVLFWGPKEASPLPWQQWSIARQARPSPGPRWGGLEAGCSAERSRDTLGAPGRDRSFELGRATARLVDVRPARDLEDAVTRIETFLNDYTSHAEYFVEGWPLLMVLMVCPNEQDTGVEIYFSCDGAANAHIRSLGERAVKALRHAHPNLGYDYIWELISD